MIGVIPNAQITLHMTDIFISYSRSDQQWVAKLAKALEDVGYSVWWDTQLLAGDDFHHTIPAVLEEARCAIVVWSKVSVEREWVRAEAYRANERKVLVPVIIDQTRIPLPFNLLHAEDLERWDGNPKHVAFQRLLKSVARYCSPPKPRNVTAPEPEPKPDISPPKQSRAVWWLVGVAVAVLTGGSYAYLKNNTTNHQVVFSMPPLPSAPVPTQPEPVSKSELQPEPKPVEEKEVAPKSPAASTPTSSTSADKLIAGRYLDNGDGTVTDTQTKLMWKKCIEGQSGNTCGGKTAGYTWDDAMARFKEGVSFAGYNDWRMPTKDELKSLVYCSNGTKTPLLDFESCGKVGTYKSPTINLQVFPNTPELAYWSVSFKDASDVGFVYLYDGSYYKWIGTHPDSALAVRLVHSGQ